ncbi:adenosylhomocysteinase [Candidatus Actinomarina sp.]|jgi:adenosylhomocysteinase|nr:adenosylhomocysteinase [Acidimicrobiia bacterium]MDA8653086.1 adenosylhomocysteinase [Candidatus Actinomarina sp.]MDA8719775.1 adenosylhomocysteinase [Candidatus Actinomarina sp.]MDA8812641.1 adenosylhomocysteinase [Candidatus Actinomarina sp.]MDA8964235.1 adenosylhomocysteinase [Acidimicrobiia bacterium]|tara:strand:+ start:139 stop:1383 length:1245 start_codon:yes stop_codon:yes gene_type:complete
MSSIKDSKLAQEGSQEVDWAARQMKVLEDIKTEFSQSKPLEGLNIGACMHVTKETANLMLTLKAAGANVALCASNPLSTKDSVAAFLAESDVEVHAIHGVSNDDFFNHLNAVLDTKPDITMDDGADLVSLLHTERADLPVMGSMEETTTGVIRLKSMEKNNKLRFPVVAVNDSDTKHLFDNRFGTGQSAMDGVVRATDLLIAGLNVVVIGFGDCGKGVAERAYGMGAKVTVVEPNSVRALEALMHGYEVKTSINAAKIADVIISVTGNMHALDKQHFDVMKDGVALANAGHFDVEINLAALKEHSTQVDRVREHVESYKYDGKEILILAEGRLVNLAAATGHPASVMDMSFANQALAAEWIKDNYKELEPKVYTLPSEVDLKIAATKLGLMGGELEILTQEQVNYLDSWEHGTS